MAEYQQPHKQVPNKVKKIVDLIIERTLKNIEHDLPLDTGADPHVMCHILGIEPDPDRRLNPSAGPENA